MEEDLKELEKQDILQSCLVKKITDSGLINDHIEFSYWVHNCPENFKLIPSKKSHKYDIYRYREKKIIKKNVSIKNISKSLVNLPRVERVIDLY